MAGGISFTAMKYMGNSHIDDCYRIALAALEHRQLERAVEDDAVIEADAYTPTNGPTRPDS